MTECPSIPSTAHRLLRPNRPTPLVRGHPESCVNGADRPFPGAKPNQRGGQNPESADITTNTKGLVAATEQDDTALSP